MASRRIGSCPKTGERTWIRDCLHDLRDYAKSKELTEADRALRTAIIEVSVDAGIATLLPLEDIIDDQSGS